MPSSDRGESRRRPVAVRVLSGVPRASRSEIPDAPSQVASDRHETKCGANELMHARTFDPANELTFADAKASDQKTEVTEENGFTRSNGETEIKYWPPLLRFSV
jgi:hypothetical protein